MERMVGTALTSLVKSILSRLGKEGDRRAMLRAEAIEDILRALRELRRVVYVSHPDGHLPPEDPEPAIKAWREVLSRHEHRLPSKWPGLMRSVLGAVGEHFGRPRFAGLHPRHEGQPWGKFLERWWEDALGYLDYCSRSLEQWRDRPARPPELLSFDGWLAASSRQAAEV